MKDEADGASPLQLAGLIEKFKRPLENLPQDLLEWGAVISVLAVFGWLEIKTPQAIGTGAAGLVLVGMVLVEMVVLIWVNRRFS